MARTGAGAALNPDDIRVVRWVLVGVFIVFACSAAASATALYAIGIAQGLPPQIAWVTPVMIDASILVFTMVALIQKRRGNKLQRFLASGAVLFSTLASSTLNVVHSYTTIGYQTPLQRTVLWVSAVVPLFILTTTEGFVSLVTKQPPEPRTVSERPAPARKKPAATRGGARGKQGPAVAPAASPGTALPTPIRPQPVPAAFMPADAGPVRVFQPPVAGPPRSVVGS